MHHRASVLRHSLANCVIGGPFCFAYLRRKRSRRQGQKQRATHPGPYGCCFILFIHNLSGLSTLKILLQTIIMIQDYYALTLVRYLINLRVMSFTNCDIGGPFYIAYLFVAQSFILTECNNVSVTKKTTFHFRCQLSLRLTCATRKKCPW